MNEERLYYILMNILEELDVMKSATLDTYYPVGSIYISASSTFDPNVSFGGTWVKLTNKFLVGAGDTYALGATGGEAEHTLEISEMPAHSHYMYYVGTTTQSSYKDYFTNSSVTTWGNKWREAGQTAPIGQDRPHNNLPPYQAVYMWQRTA